jgi:hypothetical protein
MVERNNIKNVSNVNVSEREGESAWKSRYRKAVIGLKRMIYVEIAEVIDPNRVVDQRAFLDGGELMGIYAQVGPGPTENLHMFETSLDRVNEENVREQDIPLLPYLDKETKKKIASSLRETEYFVRDEGKNTDYWNSTIPGLILVREVVEDDDVAERYYLRGSEKVTNSILIILKTIKQFNIPDTGEK